MLHSKEKAEYYKNIAQKVETLFTVGQTWGLTEEEVDLCIKTAILTPVAELKQSSAEIPHSLHKNSCSSVLIKLLCICWCCIKSAICCLGMVIGVILAFYTLMTWHPETDRFLGRIANPYTYQMYRFFRLATLPLTQSFHLTCKCSSPQLI